MSGLDRVTPEDVDRLTRPERARLCVQLATALYVERGWLTKQRVIARELLPHFQRLGLPTGLRQIQRYVKTAEDEYRAGCSPESIEATREVLGLDARKAAVKLWAAFDVMCPDAQRITDTSENERSALRAEILAVCRLAETAIKVDDHVAKLYGLHKTQSDAALLSDTEQMRMALEMFERLAPMLSPENRRTLLVALNAANKSVSAGSTPVLRLVRGADE